MQCLRKVETLCKLLICFVLQNTSKRKYAAITIMCWCRVVLKLKANPDELASVANLLVDNRDALGNRVSSASIGEPQYLIGTSGYVYLLAIT